MRVNHGLIGWGVFLILVGAIPLAVTAGYLSAAQVEDWWSLWPLILIGIGVGLILRRTSLEFLGGLIVAATFGLMVGSIAAVGFGGFGGVNIGACSGEGGTPFGTQSGQLAHGSRVAVQFDCGDLAVKTGAGNEWSLAGRSENGEAPEIDSTATSLEIRRHDREGLRFGGREQDWELTLPSAVPLDLSVELNAGSGDVDLAGASLARTEVDLNAGSITLDLGGVTAISALDVALNAGSIGITLPSLSMNGTIQANAGSVEVCAPAGAGLRIRVDSNPLTSNDYASSGLVRTGDVWTSPGYGEAAVRIDLETTGAATSFSLNPEGGCDG